MIYMRLFWQKSVSEFRQRILDLFILFSFNQTAALQDFLSVLLTCRTMFFLTKSTSTFKWTNAKALQSPYNNMVENGEILRAGKWQWRKVSLKFLFKCRQCYWWRHFWRKTVPGFCRRNTKRSVADCSETCLWYGKIRWWRRTQTLSTWKIGDML